MDQTLLLCGRPQDFSSDSPGDPFPVRIGFYLHKKVTFSALLSALCGSWSVQIWISVILLLFSAEEMMMMRYEYEGSCHEWLTPPPPPWKLSLVAGVLGIISKLNSLPPWDRGRQDCLKSTTTGPAFVCGELWTLEGRDQRKGLLFALFFQEDLNLITSDYLITSCSSHLSEILKSFRHLKTKEGIIT